MPRCARWVLPGKPHHITQRGTGRQRVFYSRRDCRVYLEQLRVNAAAEHVLVLAFSLMTNHIHLFVVPPDEESLAIAIRRTHGRYAQYLNARKLRTGHCGRTISSPVRSKTVTLGRPPLCRTKPCSRRVGCLPGRLGMVQRPRPPRPDHDLRLPGPRLLATSRRRAALAVPVGRARP